MELQQIFKNTDFISIDNSFYYLPQENSIYYKLFSKQHYIFILKLDYNPEIKITNREFNHRIVFLKVKTLKILNNLIESGGL